MKKLSILAIAAIALLGAGCKRNIDAPDAPVVESRDLKISVQSATATRAAEEATGDESKINAGWCFVFRGDANSSTLDCAPFKLNTSSAVNTIKVTTLAQTVFVVANADDLNVDYIRTIADLKAQTTDLFKEEEMSQKSNNLTMWGQDAINKDKANLYTATVTMRFAPAKVNFTYSIADDQSAQFTNPEIVVINAQGLTRLIPNYNKFEASKAEGEASLMPEAPKYYSAITEFGQGDVKQALKVSPAVEKVASTFYLFENTSAAKSIIAVRGTYAGQTIYFPVHFSADDKGSVAFEPIVAGKIYNVNVKINHLSGGVTDPSVPVTHSSLEVTIIPAAWYTSISWEKEFD